MSLRLLILLFFSTVFCFGQTEDKHKKSTLDISEFYGSILMHNSDVSHLITSHPMGLIMSYNKKTYGLKEWEQAYNYPDVGGSFIYQEMNNSTLGRNFGLYAHYNFYFFKRNLQFRLAQGLAYNTNPYDKDLNFSNNAYGSHVLSSTYLMLNYHKENIIDGLGFKTGISLIHYSNANVKAPNTSTNTFAFNLGLVYDLDGGAPVSYVPAKELEKITEPVHYNFVFRSGINESDVVNSGQFPFYVLSAYADKRLSRKSGIQLGADVFFSNMIKELILYRSISFPEEDIDPDTDSKRVGLFAGYELYINKMSLLGQFGYYVYYPYDFEGRTYLRIGMKYYFNKKLFGVISLKSHGAKAEAVEFGIGIRL